ncbi:MAG TPA: DUF4349 domain-containing protein [Thermoanaerobaculia bacterium]
MAVAACDASKVPYEPAGDAAAVEVAEESLGAIGYAAGAEAPGRSSPAPPGATPAPAPPAAPRKLVRTVQLVLTVGDSEAAAERVEALVEAAGGYVSASEATRRPDELLFVRMTLRVPGERLEEVVDAVRGLAERVERQNLSTEDVTDRYVDLEARLRALRATEAELTALLGESRSRGHSAEDIMAIYRELTGIRSQIEQLQGQLQQLADRVTYSTIQLELRPAEAGRPLVDEGWQPGATLRNSVRGLVAALQWLVDAAIVLVVAVLPILVLVGLAIWLIVRLARRSRRRRPAPTPPAGE